MKYINIFTDASMITTEFGESVGCAGAICKEDNSICKFEILRDSTNNISEITAIRLAIELAIIHATKNTEIHIWADSQWAIYGLTKWNRSWTKNMNNYIMYNSSEIPVKNQHIFLSIMKMIIDNNLHINFHHIKGHVKLNNKDSVEKAINSYSNSNNVLVFDKQFIYEAFIMNDIVDRTTRDILKNTVFKDRVYLSRGFINPIINNLDIYYNLVTLGGNSI